jgi:septum formation protein
VTKFEAMRPLILASTSPYRRELLERLRVPFSVVSPQVDEEPTRDETPRQTALRLAQAKARAVAEHHPQAVVIGSDQVANLEGHPIGKPGTHERAESVVFHTALAVQCVAAGHAAADIADVRVTFRVLDDISIERYLRLEQPYDCAGSAKSEALGIALLERIDSDDPTALVGLPLIRTARMLRAAGIDVLHG